MTLQLLVLTASLLSTSEQLSICLEAQDHTHKEITEEIKRLENEPSLESKLTLAKCYIKSNEIKKALKIYSSLEEKYGAEPILYKQMGQAFYEGEDYENALKYLIKSIQDDNKDPEAILFIGLSFYKKGEIDHGIQALEMGISELPPGASSKKQNSYSTTSEDLHFYLSQMYIHQGKAEAAAKTLKKGLSLYPGSKRLFEEIMSLDGGENNFISPKEIDEYCSAILVNSSTYCLYTDNNITTNNSKSKK